MGHRGGKKPVDSSLSGQFCSNFIIVNITLLVLVCVYGVSAVVDNRDDLSR